LWQKQARLIVNLVNTVARQDFAHSNTCNNVTHGPRVLD
jgi:hypothetical protein